MEDLAFHSLFEPLHMKIPPRIGQFSIKYLVISARLSASRFVPLPPYFPVFPMDTLILCVSTCLEWYHLGSTMDFQHLLRKMRLDHIKSLFTGNRQDDGYATEMNTLRDNPSDNVSLLSRDEHSPSTETSIQDRDGGEKGLSDPQSEENGSTTPPKHWIRGVYLCAVATGILLLINLALFATAAGLSRKYPGNSGLPSWATFYHGDCTLAERLEITLHLIINVLSTGILAASNYCMQTLVAPTRDDIDKCHERREWLYVGRASLRNLLYVKRYRAGLWVVLMITATPFHLLCVLISCRLLEDSLG